MTSRLGGGLLLYVPQKVSDKCCGRFQCHSPRTMETRIIHRIRHTTSEYCRKEDENAPRRIRDSG